MQSSTAHSQGSAPFRTNLTKCTSSDSSQASTTPQTVPSTSPDTRTESYTHLLAASYRPKQNDFAVPKADSEYLSRELNVERLDKIHRWLWLAGRPMWPRALHYQKFLGRDVVLTEQMDMHLVWTNSRIFLKPLQRFLLVPRFWEDYLSCSIGCTCSLSTGPRSAGACEQQRLRQCALGFLMSYVALVQSESDFGIAQETHLLYSDISWPEWKIFVSEILEDKSINQHIGKRFEYGELRLNRLNIIYRLTAVSVRGYKVEYNRYSSFFRDNFNWLITLLAYEVLILTAMQVGLTTKALQNSDVFQTVSYGFTFFAILSCLVGVVLVFVLFLFFLIFNGIGTMRAAQERSRRSNQ